MSPPTPPAFAAPCHPSTGADYVEPSAPLEATAVESVREWHALRCAAMARPMSMPAFDRCERARALALDACVALLRSYGHVL